MTKSSVTLDDNKMGDQSICNPEPDQNVDACLARWPDLRRYADTARLETVYDAQRDCWRACVTVTVFDNESHNEG